MAYEIAPIQGLDLPGIDRAIAQNKLFQLQTDALKRQDAQAMEGQNALKTLVEGYQKKGDVETANLLRAAGPGVVAEMAKNRLDPSFGFKPVGNTLLDLRSGQPKVVYRHSNLTLDDGTPFGGGVGAPARAGSPPAPSGDAAAIPPAQVPEVFRDTINQHAERTGLDPNLFGRMIGAESRFRTGAVSPKGAEGLGQVMPGTGRDPGYGVAPLKDSTPEENLRFSADYLKAMQDRYSGNPAVALAAYNWGPDNVDKWLAAGADPRKLPGETQRYIATVTGRPFTGLQQVAADGGASSDAASAPPAGGAPGLRYVRDENGKPVTMGDGLVMAVDGQGNTIAAPMRGAEVRTLSAPEVATLGLPAGTVVQRKPDGSLAILSKPETLTPEQEAQKIRLAQAGKPSVNVQVSGDKKGAEKLYTDAAEAFTAAQGADRQASRNALLYDQFDQALQAFRPGAGADTRLKAGQILQGLGINAVNGVSEGELAKAIGAQLELAAAQSMKGQGQITEGERAILRAGIPALTTTLDGNRKIIDLMRRLDSHDKQVAQIYRDNARANGGIVDPVSVAEEVSRLGAPLSNADLSWLQKGQRQAPAGLPPTDQRKIGEVYDTPRGRARWMGNGWELQGQGN